MNFSATDQRDVPGLAPAEVLLQEHPFGIIDVLEPRTRIGQRFAKDCVDRAGWGTERILENERLRVTIQNGFGLQTVARHVSLWKGDLELVTELPGKVAVPFNFHRV